MIPSLNAIKHPFFIGVAGTGMSAIAQFLQGLGRQVSGSDRYFVPGQENTTRRQLEQAGIRCFSQTGEGITNETDLVVVSTAVEDTVAEVQKAKALGLPIMKRSELLALIAASYKTIAIGGTSGKSTTSALLFDILQHAGIDAGIISGAGLVRLIQKGLIGNAWTGQSEWLVIEADESDGSIVQYKPELGVLLNVDKDHKDMDQLMEIFRQFRDNSRQFLVNQAHPLAAELSVDAKLDFGRGPSAGYCSSGFIQEGFQISFSVNGQPFRLPLVGEHNMENVVAAAAAAAFVGVSLETSARALENYEGIYRRNQLLGRKRGVWLIDDYAHNPVKCAAAIRACQPIAPKLLAWFQPHGYGPTRFLRNDFVAEIAAALRPGDEIWMSEIFYAGGTAVKDISANDLIEDLKKKGCNAFFVEHRQDLVSAMQDHFTNDCVLLLMGARDPSLEYFAKECWNELPS
ncbi:MAG: UDP-N-acetylmuramate--L-alanine ligase [Chitinophagaceae bacterium]